MVDLRWTTEAETWLKDIFDFIAKEDDVAAKRTVEGIRQKAQILRRFPRIGHKYRLSPEGEIRILMYGHYRIAYLMLNKGPIDILGVFHSALDIDRYL